MPIRVKRPRWSCTRRWYERLPWPSSRCSSNAQSSRSPCNPGSSPAQGSGTMSCTAGIHASRLCKQQSCISSTSIHTQLTSELHTTLLALHSTYTPLPHPNHGARLTPDAQARRASFCSRPSRSHTDAARSPGSMPGSCVQTRTKRSVSLQRSCSSAARPRWTRPHPSSTGGPRGSRPRAGQQDDKTFLYMQQLRENGWHRPAEAARCSGRTRDRARGKDGRGHVMLRGYLGTRGRITVNVISAEGYIRIRVTAFYGFIPNALAWIDHHRAQAAVTPLRKGT
jgi:hypothetical protein